MRKITISEMVSVLLGVFIIIVGLRFISIPESYNQSMTLFLSLIKYTTITLGIVVLLFGVISLCFSRSLFKQPTIRKFLQNIAILVITTFFCAVFFEIILQVTFPESCKQDDAVYEHSYTPNCHSRFTTFEWDTDVKINAEGFRDDEIAPKEQFDLRILMLGDSMTWGYGVEKEETFSEVLQQKLKIKGVKADVINAGATSYSPTLEYLLLKNKGLSYRPDIVILNLDMSDIQDDYNYNQERDAEFDQDGNVIRVSGINKEQTTLLYKIRNKMQINRFIFDKLNLIDSRFFNKEGQNNSILLGDPRTDRYAILRDMPVQNETEHWNRTFRYISQVNELSKKNNITFVLTLYPYAVQVSPDEWASGRHMFGFNSGVVYSDAPQRKVQKYAERNHLHYVEMLDSFKESSAFPLYFAYDGHINREGHKLAAEVLFSSLVEEEIIKLPVRKVEYPTNPFQELN